MLASAAELGTKTAHPRSLIPVLTQLDVDVHKDAITKSNRCGRCVGGHRREWRDSEGSRRRACQMVPTEIVITAVQ